MHISIRISSTGWELSSTLLIWVFKFGLLQAPAKQNLTNHTFQYPQNLALQRFPVGKWIRWAYPDERVRYADKYYSFNIFVWAVALLAHAACKSFGALFAVRFILGVCEGCLLLYLAKNKVLTS